jgi:hypothetical protein
VHPQLGIPPIVIFLNQIRGYVNFVATRQFGFALLMSFGFCFRPFVLQFFQFGWGEFISLRDRFTLRSIQLLTCRLNRLNYCPTIIISIRGINNGVCNDARASDSETAGNAGAVTAFDA